MPSRREFFGAAGFPALAVQGVRRDRVGVGLIGCGGRGSYLAGVVQQLGQEGAACEVAAVCDIYAPRREQAAQRFAARAYRLPSELLADPRVDAVVIATPDRVHVYNALEAVRAGKDIYCEKPLTHWRQFDKLKELVREARARKTVFQVGAQWVTDPVWLRAAEMVKAGAIGKPVHAQAGYFRRGDGGERGMRVDDPNARPGADLNWDAFQADAPQRPFSISRFFQWRMYMDYSGGPSTDLYPHPMTRLFRVLGVDFPRKVAALGGKYVYNGERDVPDTFDLLIQYPNNMTVAVLGTICNEQPIETIVRGTDGTLTFGEGGFTIQGVARRTQTVNTYRYEHEHIRNWLDSIRSRRPPNGDLELGYRVQVPLIMSMLSYVEGKVAYFDAANETISLA